jgi:FkbM family methyltransferase
MKAMLGKLIDRTIKRRVVGSSLIYMMAKRVVSAYENHDVGMPTNGELWLLERIAARGPVTAIDVGANLGEWVEGVLKVSPNAVVLCYEPVPTTFALLAKNVSAPGVTLINKGLSSLSGELEIHSVLDMPNISSMHEVNFFGPDHEIETISVPIGTGDEEMARHGLSRVSIVKVDAEGHDLNVIEGFGTAIVAGTIDVFQFEYNQFTLSARRALRDFFALLNEHYLLCRLLPNGLEACGYHPLLDNFCQSNWVAVRRAMLDAEFVRHFSIRPARGVACSALKRDLARDDRLAALLGLSV